MAAVALNIAPGLRHWRQAGISHVLVSGDVAASLRQAATQQGSSRKLAAPVSAPQSGAERDLPARADASSSTMPGSPAPQPEVKKYRSPDLEQDAAPPTRPVVPPRSEPAPLPPAWQSLWVQISAASPRPVAVWTYAELGTDLRGTASQERRTALQTLLGSLRMPKGSNAFWPYRLPGDAGPCTDHFLSGLQRLRPGVVFVLGDTAAQELATLGEMPGGALQEVMCRNFRFVRLPDLTSLGHVDAQQARLSAFIKTMLS